MRGLTSSAKKSRGLRHRSRRKKEINIRKSMSK
jgi:ribosomal protein L15E